MAARNLASEILEGLAEFQAWRRGEARLRVRTVELPRAADVVAIRRNLGLSQDAFAAFMCVSLGTLRNWEQQRREPQGPARALLQVASLQPKAVLSALEPRKAKRGEVQAFAKTRVVVKRAPAAVRKASAVRRRLVAA